MMGGILFSPPQFWYSRWHPVSQLSRFPSLFFCMIYIFRRVTAKEKNVIFPSVGVGSLALGGAGKTTVALTVAEKIRDSRNAKVGIVHSGYGGRKKGVFTEPEDGISDEALLAIYRGFPVSLGKDRIKAVEMIKNVVDYIVFDDHFSALISPIVEIIVFTKDSFGNGLVQPFGPLREPLISLLWSDCVLLEREFKNTPEERKIRRFSRKISYFSFGVKHILSLKPDSSVEKIEVDKAKKELRGGRAILFSSIAIPSRLRKTAKKLGIIPYEHIALKDHSFPSEKHINYVKAVIKEKNRADFLFTTEKDFWKFVLLGMKKPLDFPVFAPSVYAELPEEIENKINSL